VFFEIFVVDFLHFPLFRALVPPHATNKCIFGVLGLKNTKNYQKCSKNGFFWTKIDIFGLFS